jgi:hypothetical protein
MDPATHDLPALSTCTTCQFSEDFSNYWTAVLFFRARNGTFKRVPQIAQSGMEGTRGGGMVVYYMSDALFDTAQKSTVTPSSPASACWLATRPSPTATRRADSAS